MKNKKAIGPIFEQDMISGAKEVYGENCVHDYTIAHREKLQELMFLDLPLSEKLKIGEELKTAKLMDSQNGTDFEITTDDMDLRIDVTCDFNSKNNMPLIHDTKMPIGSKGETLKIGIRKGYDRKDNHGNIKKREFETPVVVIGSNIKSDDLLHIENRYDVMLQLQTHLPDVFRLAHTCLDQYEHPENYKLDDILLKANKKCKTGNYERSRIENHVQSVDDVEHTPKF